MKKNIFPSFALRNLGTVVAIIVIFIYTIVLDRNWPCNCSAPRAGCDFYMAMPFCIIVVVQLWTDRMFLRAWGHACSRACCSSVCVLLYHLLKAGCVGLIWVVCVLIDGDWWLCCGTYGNLVCRDLRDISARELIEMKSDSMIAGMSILFAILLVACLSSLVPKTCCEDSRRCNMKIQYYKVVLEEEENVLKEVLTTSAKDKLTEIIMDKIDKTEWEKYYDVAEDVIEESPEPTLSKQQQEDKKNRETQSNNSSGRDGSQGREMKPATGDPGEYIPLYKRREAGEEKGDDENPGSSGVQ